MSLSVISPSTGHPLRSVPTHTVEQVRERLGRAEEAFHKWRDTPLAERTRLLRTTAERLRAESATHARLMVEEMGKPITQALAEIEKCAWVCEFYAEQAAAFLAPEPATSDGSRAEIRWEPLGPILAVMPWNFPYWQVFRFCAPALAAGNVGLLKHASNVPGCALAIEGVLREAGLPPGVFQTLLVPAARVGEIIRDPIVRAVTLTGSEPAGRQVAAVAGSALKKTVLELGGSDPFIVFADADLDAALAVAVRARVLNGGQSCIAAKRFLVDRALLPVWEERFAKALGNLRVGDPFDPATEVGPLARPDLLDDLERQIAESVSLGARLLTGGRRCDPPGWFYAPTLLTDVRKGMPVFDEETFGPVAALIPFSGEEDALRLANESEFGLGASVWTADPARAERMIRRLEAGAVFVNGMVKSDPRLPFGGIKRSGYGRELGRYGMMEFLNIKTVWVR